MWKEMAQLGWLGSRCRRRTGGSDLGMVECALLLEEMGRATIRPLSADDPRRDRHRPRRAPTRRSALASCRLRRRRSRDRGVPRRRALVGARRDRDARREIGRRLDALGREAVRGVAHLADVMLVPARTAEG